jgi:hypothetical protein
MQTDDGARAPADAPTRESESKRASTPPAEGERRAIRGYAGQYRFAAARILTALRGPGFEWIRIADPEAGRVDDLQIGAANRVDGYQVKWSRYPGTLTFHGFTRSSDEHPSLLRQLTDGWERLRRAHPGRRVVVHLVTNDIASISDAVAVEEGRSRELKAFAAFLLEAWARAHAELEAGRALTVGSMPGGATWQQAWDDLRAESGLTDDTWLRFIPDCALDLGIPSPDALAALEANSPHEMAAWRRDHEQLTHALFSLVAAPTEPVQLTRDELLGHLEWRARADFHHRHEFPEPDLPYRAVRTSADALRTALARFTRGYVLVLGSPGSGKSTLLTQTLRYEERVVRYYAYVPPSIGRSQRRGEATNFLHDVVLALEELGFRVGATLPHGDEAALAERLLAQFAALSDDYRRTGRKTVILVDGLDHIPREQRPIRSLLAELPEPTAVPDGVLIVLGSQTDRLPGLPTPVLTEISVPDRRLEMEPLGREDVFDIVRAAGLSPAPDEDEQEEIYRLTTGHPLALNYVINRLHGDLGVPVSEVLRQVAPFRDRIDNQYLEHWRQISDDVELVRLLVLVARLRGVIRLKWLRQWAPRAALHRMTHEFAYYFRRERGERWSFFHNSFRVFLIDQSATLPALESDATLFLELAHHAAGAPDGDPARVDELYYRARAGDDAGILALALPARWRAEFLAGRPAAMILADIQEALPAALRQRDVVSLTRLLLARVEFKRRSHYTGRLPLTELLIALGDTDAGVESIAVGLELNGTEETALRAAAALDDRGLREDARRIFSLAEPLGILDGSAHGSRAQNRDTRKLLTQWAEVAPRFRSKDELLRFVAKLSVVADSERRRNTAPGSEAIDHGTTAVDQRETAALRARVLTILAAAFDHLQRHEDAEAMLREVEALGDEAWGWHFWGWVHGWRRALANGQQEGAQVRYAVTTRLAATRQADKGTLEPVQRVVLAEGALRCANDTAAARALVDEVAQPEVVARDTHLTEHAFAPFWDRFLLNRVLGALGDESPPASIVPDAIGEGQPVVLFERSVVTVARLAGMPWTGRKLSPANFVNECRGFLRLFVARAGERAHWREGWSLAMAARQELYTILVATAAAHGDDVVTELRLAFDTEWSTPDFALAWPNELKRAIVLAFLKHRAPREWAVAHLKDLEPSSFPAGELETELPLAVAHALAWLEVDEPALARHSLRVVLASTLGVEHKDYQFDAWVEWVRRANDDDIAGAPERVAVMAAAASGLRDVEGYSSAVRGILSIATRCGPLLSTSLLRWYLTHAITTWTEAFEAYLIGTVARSQGAMPYAARLFRHLVLPYERGAEVELVGVLHRADDSSAANTTALAELAEGIEVHALGSTRPALRAALRGDADEAETLGRREYDRESPDDKIVDGIEGVSLSLRELRAQASTLDGARSLIGRLKGDSYLVPWNQIFRDLIAAADRQTLVEFETILPQSESTWRVWMDLANRLADLGEMQAAARIADRVFTAARPSGWIRWHDGGSRVVSLSLLARLDPARAQERAWAVLGDDIVAGRVDAFTLATEWHRLVPLLTDVTPSVEIWNEILPFIQATVAHTEMLTPPTLPEAVGPADMVVTVAASEILGLVGEYLDHPMYELMHGAQRLFVDLLLAGDSFARQALLHRLSDPEGPGDGALDVLLALSSRDPALVKFAGDTLYARRTVKDIRARLRIAALLSQLGRPLPVAPTMDVRQPLPAAYQVIGAENKTDRPLREAAFGEYLPPAQSAVDLVRMYAPLLHMVSRMAGVRYEALARDIAARAGATAGDPTPPDDEPMFRRQMDGMGLQMLFRRPRARRVERAMLEAVADLQDRGYLAPTHNIRLALEFENADPEFLLARPSRRPAVVAPIAELAMASDSMGRYVKENWTQGVELDASAVGRPVDQLADRIVIAEETWVQWLDWKEATETRVGLRVPLQVEEKPRGRAHESIDEEDRAATALRARCGTSEYTRVAEYLTTPVGPSLLLRQYALAFETPAKYWLAINPELGRRLGWTPSAEGLFRWVDDNGRLMAESLWWEDGSRSMRPPHFEDEIGRGWLVVATRPALEQIAALVGATADWARIERSAREQDIKESEGWRES